jgi:amino acid adenylation domain-containing protein
MLTVSPEARDGRLERTSVLSFGMGAQTPYERDQSLVACFARRVAETPNAVAVTAAGEALTYAELDRRSSAVACYLASLGVAAEDGIGVCIERSILLPIALLGILKAGAAYVPLDRAYTRERLEHILADAAVAVVVVAGDDHDALPRDTVRIVDLVRDTVAIAAAGESVLAHVPTATSLAYVMYTSGSTGRPKGVAIEHRAIMRLVRGSDFVDIAVDDVFLQLAPPAFDASTFEIWAPLLNGATLAIPAPGALSLEEIGATLERFSVTTLWLTAPLFRMMVETELPRFARLRNLLTGGDVVSAEHARRFIAAAPSCRLIDGYGPTENTTFSCCYTVPVGDVGSTIPIGRPIANSRAYVLDDAMQPVAFGADGELFVGGDGLARGYLNLPELNAERFVRDPFAGDGSRLYRTGDRARLRPDGVIEFLGRLDNQVKIRGFRIELDEIEAALHAHDAVLHAVVVVEERAGEKTLHAVVVATGAERVSVADLRAYLGARLPAYMIPHRFSFREALPQFTSGKIDRVTLARDVAPARGPILARRSADNETTLAIANIWKTTLENAEVGNDENFFDAGGDSLLLLVLHKRMKQAFSVDISVTDLFRESTIRKQAALIDRVRA